MRKHEQQVIEDDLTVARSKKRSSTSGDETCYIAPIPVDLVINILSRLSLECIARCRCVSKMWSSIIRRPNYNLLFPLKSPATPRLLFVFKVPGELLFNISPQHFNPDRHSSLVATSLQKTTCNTSFFQLCRPVHGLVCCQHIEENYSSAVISNPITGEYLALPKLRMKGVNSETRIGKVSYSFGYDPIDKQFKVLRITLLPRDSQWWYSEYQVLTLGLGNLSWRKIQCCTPHYILEDYGICINGVLYYPARLNTGKYTMVCFDVRSEKFSFIDIDKDVSIVTYLLFSVIDYNGKLGACICDHHHNFELWVLENAEEHKWSKHIYKMPHLGVLECAGMIASGEIVLYPRFSAYTRYPFLYFYNLERNIITRVTLQVPIRKQLTYGRFYTFSNFVEDVTLI
ncbi:unnamed protein product [Arabidopsis halleri]